MTFNEIVEKKLQRINAHSKSLNDKISAWKENNDGLKIVNTSNTDKKKITHTIKFNTKPEVIDWGITLGELAYSARSLLDNIIYELSEAKTNKNEFPIFKEQAKYNCQKEKKLKGIKNQAKLKLIEKLQPFNESSPETHFLWLLHTINIYDKHQTPTILLLNPKAIELNTEIIFQNKMCKPIYHFDFNQNELKIVESYKFPYKKIKESINVNIQIGVVIEDHFYGIRDVCNYIVHGVFAIKDSLLN